jgi:hypothetical protein
MDPEWLRASPDPVLAKDRRRETHLIPLTHIGLLLRVLTSVDCKVGSVGSALVLQQPRCH